MNKGQGYNRWDTTQNAATVQTKHNLQNMRKNREILEKELACDCLMDLEKCYFNFAVKLQYVERN